MPANVRRRDFLKTAAATGAAASIGAWSELPARASSSPNEKLNIAIIGAGGRGADNVASLAGENLVAMCDVDGRRAGRTFERYPQVKKYHDFRRMLDEMDRQIDAVAVSAPNHIHVPASVTAMRMGKHCYCEKPLAHSLHEARLATKVAAETKVATQMGTQIHATENYRRIVELIRSGAIGPVREVRIRLAGGGTAGDRPTEMPPVPPELKWDLWLGPAPYRPYHPCYVPHDWHYWWDFGGGPLGNMGCHYIDLAFWALELRHPKAIQSEGSPRHPESTPALQTVHWEFPARGELPPVTLTWDHGRKRPPFWVEHKLPDWAWGVFVGSGGMLLASYDKRALWPKEKFADFTPPEPSIPKSVGHHQEWINACKTGSPTTCNFDYSGAVTETVLLGNVAYRYGEKIEWDAEKMRIPNAPVAEQYLQRAYRKGWEL
jgi:predicted dehydrogenase